MNRVVIEKTVYEESNHYVHQPFREIHKKYKRDLANKIGHTSKHRNNSTLSEHKIYEHIRRIAIDIHGESRINWLDEEEIELSKVIMNDIYFYLLNGYVPKKEERKIWMIY